MKDYDIRKVLKKSLLDAFPVNSQALVLDELGVGHGAARIDIAVINSNLLGFEIKSDEDTLERLLHQARFYNQVFDYITLVVGYRHAYEAFQIIPEWWGVKLADMKSNGDVEIAEARDPRQNPTQNARAIVELLWREEALSILNEIDAAKGVCSKPKAAMYDRIVEVMDTATVRSKVCHQLKLRTNWRSG